MNILFNANNIIYCAFMFLLQNEGEEKFPHDGPNTASLEHNEIFNSTIEYRSPSTYKAEQNSFPLRNFENAMQYKSMKDKTLAAGKDLVRNNAGEKSVDGTGACCNLVVYSKIVFVPAPANQGMYSGYFTASMF